MVPAAVDDYLLPGQVISGRFRLERQLGHGGMGTVWEARHLSLETQIAIKFLNADLSRREDVLARFAREATSAARIRSPHVVSILDSGFTDDGHGFIAMELLRGEDLSRRLARFGKLTVGETALLVTQVSRGLAKAHSVGVVHRDLKPENIFVMDEDDAFTIKILDFGIAKSIGPEAATHKTDTGQLLGTPLYMSPEQALGRPIDSRSDLYSLAVLAYRCLAGRPPFIHPAVGELIVALSTHLPPPPSEFNAALPASLDEWFARALAKEPAARICQTAGEVAESFKRACGSALQDHHRSSGRLRVVASSQSLPPTPSNDTEEVPVPSAEEVATTISAPHLALLGPRSSVPPSRRLDGWRSRTLIGLLVASSATFAFRLRGRGPNPARQAAAPERTIESNGQAPLRRERPAAETTAPASEEVPRRVMSEDASTGNHGASTGTGSDGLLRAGSSAHEGIRADSKTELARQTGPVSKEAEAELAASARAPAGAPAATPAASALGGTPGGVSGGQTKPSLPPIDRGDPWVRK